MHYIHDDEAFDGDSNAIIDLLVLHNSGKKQLQVTSALLSDIGANSFAPEFAPEYVMAGPNQHRYPCYCFQSG